MPNRVLQRLPCGTAEAHSFAAGKEVVMVSASSCRPEAVEVKGLVKGSAE